MSLDGLELYVGGIAEHPDDSYFVYVFVNQPEATPDDAKPDNPNFAGTFGVFGGHEVDQKMAMNGNKMPRRVMRLFEGLDNPLQEQAQQITLVVTDETGAVVASEIVPFDSVSLRKFEGDIGAQGDDDAVNVVESVSQQSSESDSSWREFWGTSNSGSFDEAYRDAVAKARSTFGENREVAIGVVDIQGSATGESSQLKVTIRAKSN